MVHTRAWPRISPSTKIYFFCHFRGLFAYTASWYNRASGAPKDPWVSLGNHPTGMLYGKNALSGVHTSLISGNEGMCVWVRSSTDTQTTIQPITISGTDFKYSTFLNTGAGCFTSSRNRITITIIR